MGRLAGFKQAQVIKGPAGQMIRHTPISNHPGDLPEGTLRAILKQAHIEPEEFLNS